MQSHIHKVHACIAVTCHLHFWQNDRDLLHATTVTRGWNGYRNKSQHRKLALENLPPLLPGLEPGTFRSRVRRSNHWALPAPQRDERSGKTCKYKTGHHCSAAARSQPPEALLHRHSNYASVSRFRFDNSVPGASLLWGRSPLTGGCAEGGVGERVRLVGYPPHSITVTSLTTTTPPPTLPQRRSPLLDECRKGDHQSDQSCSAEEPSVIVRDFCWSHCGGCANGSPQADHHAGPFSLLH